MTDQDIRDDLHDACGHVDIAHILKHGPGTVVLYQVVETGQYRVALYDSQGEAQFDLVIEEDD